MVTIEKLKKNYKDFSLDLSLEIPAGRIVGLVGKNGAGKSTTIKSILALIKPDGGDVRIFGKPVSELTSEDKQELGIALAESGFSPYLNVEDVAAILKNSYAKFDRKAFLEACQKQGLPLKKDIKAFSTGMKAKLRVLVALSHEARLLIMDEPTAGLDVEARMEILDILRDYLVEDENRAVLITSHIATDLEGLCDEIYLIHKGKVILHEDTDVIMSDYAVLKMDDAAYEKLDKSYILAEKKELFGYVCLTNEKQYYADNYPKLVIENSGIDELILMLAGGK